MAAPNTEPVDYRVLADLATTLQTISQANNCWFDVKPTSVSLEPQEVILVPDTEVPFVLVVPAPDGRRRWWPAYQLEDDIAAVILARIDVTSVDEPGAKLKAGQRIVADIERRLTVDISRGGLCVDTRLQKPRILYGLGNDPIVLVEQLVLMRRHRTYGQPES
jgi:hypothetical protein